MVAPQLQDPELDLDPDPDPDPDPEPELDLNPELEVELELELELLDRGRVDPSTPTLTLSSSTAVQLASNDRVLPLDSVGLLGVPSTATGLREAGVHSSLSCSRLMVSTVLGHRVDDSSGRSRRVIS